MLVNGCARLAVVALALGGVAVGAGCGGGDDSGRIRDVVVEVQRAFAENDYEAICAATTRAAQRHVGHAGHGSPATCRRGMRGFVEMVKENPVARGSGPPRVRSVNVDGDRGVAVVVLPNGAATRLPMAEEDGRWKLDAVYGGMPAGRQQDKY